MSSHQDTLELTELCSSGAASGPSEVPPPSDSASSPTLADDAVYRHGEALGTKIETIGINDPELRICGFRSFIPDMDESCIRVFLGRGDPLT